MQFRMPPLLAAFISSHFYDGKLLTHPSRAASSLLSHHAPLLQLHQEQAISPSAEGVGLPRPVDDQAASAYRQFTESSTSINAGDGLYGRVALHPWRVSAVETTETGNASAIAPGSTTNKHSFPWPDGSEGDKDLARRLLQQLQTDCNNPLGLQAFANHWARAVHCDIPKVLPVLFVDTSPWASGSSRRLAKLVLPPKTADTAATSASKAAATINELAGEMVEKRSLLLRSLSAEQRVKGSLQNPLEAFLIYRCVNALLRGGASRGEIAVLTPYQAQAQLLSRVLHPCETPAKTQEQTRRSGRLSFVQPVLDVLDERYRPHPQVFTVDGFQGHEREFIILSAVKCSRRSPREFFLFDPRRINVALSRASKGLVIVGSSRALADASPTWHSFLLFLRALGAALPLDHPSLRSSLTEGLVLQRPASPHRLVQHPVEALNIGRT